MIPIVSLLVVVVLSILVTRIAAVALSLTGLSSESARFQARSAFTGVGFTTTESEKVVNHPVRRRILLLLMLLGNAGIVSAVSSLLLTGLSFGDEGRPVLEVSVLVGGLVLLWAIATSKWVDRWLSYAIAKALKRYTSLEVTDYAHLLHLTGEYRVTELHVEAGDWMADGTLGELRLRDEGIVVLGIQRADGCFVGAPDGETRLVGGDTLIVYGRIPKLAALDQRRRGSRGDIEHHEAVAEQEAVVAREEAEDPVAPDPEEGAGDPDLELEESSREGAARETARLRSQGVLDEADRTRERTEP